MSTQPSTALIKNTPTSKTKNSTQSTQNNCYLLQNDVIPIEIHVHILTYLRSYDLSPLQGTCKSFDNHDLIKKVVKHFADHVYPPELTEGYDTPLIHPDQNKKFTYMHLRNMEMLVVARILSRPEASSSLSSPGGSCNKRNSYFYVSKSWCRTALKWLEVQQEQLAAVNAAATTTTNSRNPHSKKSPGKKKMTKKQQRMRNRRLSDVAPPWPNVNSDICCPHENLKGENNSKSARAKRKVLDKQAWKVLKKLYPDSTSLRLENGECIHCTLEKEQAKKVEQDKVEKETLERKKPLSCPLVRGIYTRTRGVPMNSLVPVSSSVVPQQRQQHNNGCPLVPGLYHALPRQWLHQWRRYMKTGEGDKPCPPDSTALLCDAHRFPLIPPHLEAYLYGESQTLLAPSSSSSVLPTSPAVAAAAVAVSVATPPLASNNSRRNNNNNVMDTDTMNTLRAVGMSPNEVMQQRMAMMSLQNEQRQQHNIMTMAQLQQQQQQQQDGAATAVAAPGTPIRRGAGGGGRRPRSNSGGEELDRENAVVVEILTDEEYTALEKWWPKCIGTNFALRFAVVPSSTTDVGTSSCCCCSIDWSTEPCRECDASGIMYKASHSSMSKIRNLGESNNNNNNNNRKHVKNSKSINRNK